MITSILLGALSVMDAIAAAPSQAPAWAAVPVPATCRVETLLDKQSGRTLSLSTMPGSDHAYLIVTPHAGDALADRPTVAVQLDAGEAMGGVAKSGLLGPGLPTAIAVDKLPADFLERFGRSSHIKVLRDDTVIVEAQLDGTRQALALLRACSDATLRGWGIDPVARSALRRLPEPVTDVAGWIVEGDYPVEALRNDWVGRVVVRLDVNNGGAVVGCTTLVSSGYAVLDVQTCTTMIARGKFRPALRRDGVAVQASYVTSVGWTLAE